LAVVQNLILPALALGTVLHRADRAHYPASMLEVLQQDYVRTARAKASGRHICSFMR